MSNETEAAIHAVDSSSDKICLKLARTKNGLSIDWAIGEPINA